MPRPQRPSDLFVTNGWYLELPGLISPHFETLSGLSKKTGKVEIVDAGSNIRYKFSGQITDFGAITLGRTYDGSSDDSVFRALVEAGRRGTKIAGVLVNLHHGTEVFRIAFQGLLFLAETYPDFDINTEEKLKITYNAEVDQWILV